jgi:hypothetical protein
MSFNLTESLSAFALSHRFARSVSGQRLWTVSQNFAE